MRAWVVKKGTKYWSSECQSYQVLSRAQLFLTQSEIGKLEEGEKAMKVRVKITKVKT